MRHTTRSETPMCYITCQIFRDIEKFLRKFLNRSFEFQKDNVKTPLMNIRDVMEYFCEAHSRGKCSAHVLRPAVAPNVRECSRRDEH